MNEIGWLSSVKSSNVIESDLLSWFEKEILFGS
jgi:hypothetical protein